MANNKKETELQSKVCKWLRQKGIIFISDFAAGLYFENPYIRNLRQSQACEGKYLDLTILLPVYPYHALILELKASQNDLFLKDGKKLKSDHVQEQYNMIKNLRELGYFADFTTGYDDTINIINDYMNDNFYYKSIIERKIKVDKLDTKANDFFTKNGL